MKAKIATLTISALMLISLISVFQAGMASAQEEPELVGSYSYSWTTSIMDSTDFDFTVGMGWSGPFPWPPNVYFFFHPDEIPLGGYTEPIGGAWLFEDIDFDITAAEQTFSVASVADDPDFEGFASLLTNGIDEVIWFGYMGDRESIAGAGGQKGVQESDIFTGTDVGTDYPGWVIQRISLTFNQIYLDPANANKLVLDFTVDIYASPWITLSPDEGISVTTLVGQGFTPGAGITYAWDGEPIEMGATEVGSDGSVYAIIAVQTQGAPGVHLVTATDAEGISASATFEVLDMKGDKGAPGDDGEDGEDGALGITGPQGAQGPTGAKGDTGDVGSQGSTGSQGPQGETGAMGPKGSAGEDTQAGIAWMSMVAAIIALLVAAYAVARR